MNETVAALIAVAIVVILAIGMVGIVVYVSSLDDAEPKDAHVWLEIRNFDRATNHPLVENIDVDVMAVWNNNVTGTQDIGTAPFLYNIPASQNYTVYLRLESDEYYPDFADRLEYGYSLGRYFYDFDQDGSPDWTIIIRLKPTGEAPTLPTITMDIPWSRFDASS